MLRAEAVRFFDRAQDPCVLEVPRGVNLDAHVDVQLFGIGHAATKDVGTHEDQDAHVADAQPVAEPEVADDAFDLLVVRHEPVLAQLGVEEHVIGGEVAAVAGDHGLPFLHLGVGQVRECRHVLFGQDLDPCRADGCGEGHAVLHVHAAEEQLLLEGIEADAPLDLGHWRLSGLDRLGRFGQTWPVRTDLAGLDGRGNVRPWPTAVGAG